MRYREEVTVSASSLVLRHSFVFGASSLVIPLVIPLKKPQINPFVSPAHGSITTVGRRPFMDVSYSEQ
jgi:hypothetical protein